MKFYLYYRLSFVILFSSFNRESSIGYLDGYKDFLIIKPRTIRKYKNAVISNPELLSEWFALARVYHIRNQIENEIECLEKILELEPENKDAVFILGNIHSYNKVYEKALEYLIRFTEIYNNGRRIRAIQIRSS